MSRQHQLAVVLGVAALVLLTLAIETTTSHAALPAPRTGVPSREMAPAASQPVLRAPASTDRLATEPAPAPATMPAAVLTATPATAPIPAPATPTATAAAASQPGDCLTPGEVKTVLLSRPARINRILVEARGAGARVLVSGGEHARVLRASGAGTNVLTFEPSLQAARFDVTVAAEAVPTSATAACITRVELLAGTTEIAAFGR